MKKSSIKINLFFNLLNQFVVFTIPLIVTPYLSRVFQADGVGVNSYTYTMVSYFTLLSMFGISTYGQQSISIIRENRLSVSKLFWELQTIHLCTFLITTGAYTFIVLSSSEYRIYYVIHYLTLISCFLDISWIYQAYEQFSLLAIRNMLIKIGALVLTFLLIKQKEDLWMYILITAFSTLLSSIFLWIGINRYVDRVSFQELQFKAHFKDLFVFFVPTIAGSIYHLLDKSVIFWITNIEAENGYYEQGYRILMLGCSAVQALATVSAPRMANDYFNGNRREFRVRLNHSLQSMLLLAIPMAFGISAIAPNFVPLFFGSGYDKVITILYVFSPLVVIISFSFYLNVMCLIPSGKKSKSAMIICIGAICNGILNVFFVHSFASIGAAIATLITELLIAVLMLCSVRKELENILLCSGLRYIAYAFSMLMAVRAVSYATSGISGLIFQILVGIATYGGLLVITKEPILYGIIESLKSKK